MLQKHLAVQGVETLIHYPVPIPRQPALADAAPADCAIAARICEQVLSLPMYPSLSDAEVDQVITAVARFPA
jgi:dTDP-4-amino-4,6-dideoxygalactose transaminase